MLSWIIKWKMKAMRAERAAVIRHYLSVCSYYLDHQGVVPGMLLDVAPAGQDFLTSVFYEILPEYPRLLDLFLSRDADDGPEGADGPLGLTKERVSRILGERHIQSVIAAERREIS
jgi:hypothetical protein